MTCLWWIALDGKYIKRGRAERLPVKWWNNHTYGCIAYECVVVWYNSLRNRDACISTHYVWKCPILCFSLYFHLNWGDGHKMRKEKSPKLNQNRGCCFDVPSAIIICLLGCSSLKEMERWSERWYQVFEFMCSWQHAALLPFCMFIDAYNKHVVSLASRAKDWGEFSPYAENAAAKKFNCAGKVLWDFTQTYRNWTLRWGLLVREVTQPMASWPFVENDDHRLFDSAHLTVSNISWTSHYVLYIESFMKLCGKHHERPATTWAAG